MQSVKTRKRVEKYGHSACLAFHKNISEIQYSKRPSFMETDVTNKFQHFKHTAFSMKHSCNNICVTISISVMEAVN